MSLVVLKIGGAVAGDAAALAARLARTHAVCVVHGAGPQISAELARAGIESRFVGGRRVTTPAALELVRRSFESVNAGVCAAIGPTAVAVFGDLAGLEADPVPGLGRVGSARPSAPATITAALAAGRIPVVAPLAAGPGGVALNVNADEAASALAVGLGADRLLFVTDVPGLLLSGAVAPSIGADAAERLLDEGVLEGGIVPKLRAAVGAARFGVAAAIGETAVVA